MKDNSTPQLSNPEIALIDLSYTQRQVVIGSAIGDGCIKKQKLHSFLQVSHAKDQLEWVNHKSLLLGELVTKGVQERKPSGKNRQNIVEFRTFPNKEINEIYSKTYKSEGRTIKELIPEVDEIALSIIWGDDGSYGKVHGKYEYGILSTCAYSLEDNQLLSKHLLERFGIQNSVCKKKSYNKQYHQIRINKHGIKTLREIIERHLPNSMLYKIGGKQNESSLN